ncbi:MAG: hypothetical protein GX996_09425 [Firmicutes bacterium]|nr:hypothetical protein [Bacillota bacterium]
MQTTGIAPFVVLFGLGLVLYFFGVVFLFKRKLSYLGMVLPCFFALMALYNYLKPKLVPNPYPTMQEGLYMTFFGVMAIIGFAIFAIVKHFTR